MMGLMLPSSAAVTAGCEQAHVVLACDKKGEVQERAFFGVQLGPAEEGIAILEVISDSPADKAGFRADDVVTRFGDDAVESVEQFVELVHGHKPGDDVLVQFERDGKRQIRTVTLAARQHEVEAFAFAGEGPSMMWLPDEVREEHSDLSGKSVRVEMECEDGKGTVTIEEDGEVETHEFDCPAAGSGNVHILRRGAGGGQFMFAPRMQGLDAESAEKIHAEIEQRMREAGINREQRGGRAMKFLHDDGPSIRFREDKNGRIEAVIRKGDGELVREFDNADDMQDRAPELYEKYAELND
jgi:hypothetical protein